MLGSTSGRPVRARRRISLSIDPCSLAFTSHALHGSSGRSAMELRVVEHPTATRCRSPGARTDSATSAAELRARCRIATARRPDRRPRAGPSASLSAVSSGSPCPCGGRTPSTRPSPRDGARTRSWASSHRACCSSLRAAASSGTPPSVARRRLLHARIGRSRSCSGRPASGLRRPRHRLPDRFASATARSLPASRGARSVLRTSSRLYASIASRMSEPGRSPSLSWSHSSNATMLVPASRRPSRALEVVQRLDLLDRVALDRRAKALSHRTEQVDQHAASEESVDLLLARSVPAHQSFQRSRLV